jgi:hypothetical protein
MIINDLIILKAKNLFIQNPIYNLDTSYVEKKSASIPVISAISFMKKRDLKQYISWDELSGNTASDVQNQFMNNLGEYYLTFFALQNSWHKETNLVNYKKFWKDEEGKSLIDLFFNKQINLPDEISLRKNNDIRYGTFFEIEKGHFLKTIKLTREPSSNEILILSKDYHFDSKEAYLILEMISKRDELDSSQYLTNLCINLNLNKYVLLRSAGAFDDPDFSIDFIFQEDQSSFMDKIGI